jgi:uncharacterized membrane-anchored protein
MQRQHIPALGLRYWVALCLASIFGANSGDFFAHDIGLGHLAGLPFLAIALVAVLFVERIDNAVHEVHYWAAIVIVRTAATNLADFFSGDLRLAKIWVITALTFLLMLALRLSWRFLWSAKEYKGSDQSGLIRADWAYWVCMFVAGTLGTVIGDFCSHDWRLGDGWAAILLSGILFALFLAGRNLLLWSLPFYWLIIVMIRAAGTVVGDFFAGRNILGLPLSTLLTGLLFIGLLIVWKEPFKKREEPSGATAHPAD